MKGLHPPSSIHPSIRVPGPNLPVRSRLVMRQHPAGDLPEDRRVRMAAHNWLEGASGSTLRSNVTASTRLCSSRAEAPVQPWRANSR